MTEPTLSITCKNCSHEFTGNFCNACGQPVMKRFTAKGVWHLIVEDIFEVDKGLILTIRELWINPGKVAHEYINGITKRYYSPLKYLIFWIALFFIEKSLIVNEEPRTLKEIIFSSTAPFSAESLSDFFEVYLQVLSSHTDLFYLGLIPFLTLVSYLLYRKKKLTFPELSILYLYIFGQMAFVLVVTFPITKMIQSSALLIVTFLIMTGCIIYLLIRSHMQFFRETLIRTALETFVIIYAGQIIYYAASYALLNLIKLIAAS